MELEQQSAKAIAQNEVVLAALRAPALEALQKGIETSYTSQAKHTKSGLQIDTVNDTTHVPSMMLVDGKAESEHRTISRSGIHMDVKLKGDFNITHFDGKNLRREKSSFELTHSDWDDLWNRKDRFNTRIRTEDMTGRAVQRYEPAISEEQKEVDPNGQPVRLAKPAGDQPNCGIEDIFRAGDKRHLCEYIIDDKLSYNMTRTKDEAGWAYRSVVRDLKGKVLGIVRQDFDLDANGDIKSVSTTARKPMKVRQ